MPCYEPGYRYSKGDAILCAVFHKAEDLQVFENIIDSLDYKLIGLTKQQVIEWWKTHKSLDAAKLKAKG